MPRTRSIPQPQHKPQDAIWTIAKKVALASLLLPLLGTGVSYAAYADDLSVSTWPWKIGLFITATCFLSPFAIAARYRRTNLLWICGLIHSISMFSVYFFFGIFAYFFYFIFAPLPPLFKWPGLLGGVALTLYWLIITARGVSHTIEATTFVNHAFVDEGSHFAYEFQAGLTQFEKRHKERLPFPKIYYGFVFGIAPFYLVLNRLLSASLGANGVLLVLAILGMPMSLWAAGVIVRVYLVMIRLPRQLEKKSGKPVLVVE
jgi:hypothetical protein